VALLSELTHHRVVRLHDVFREATFEYMVMDKYNGGELGNGMMSYWKSVGMIPMRVIIRLTVQMLEGLSFLHSKWIVHKDVKGENFLMDRPDLTDPQVQICLSDFGSAAQILPVERLSDHYGTKIYWAPERFAMNYGLKVDIWACGVLYYALLTKEFPFHQDAQSVKKKLKFPADVAPRLTDSARKLCEIMLEKDEQRRARATTAYEYARSLQGEKNQNAFEAMSRMIPKKMLSGRSLLGRLVPAMA
jgi:serine/threonine protein kinase